MGKKLGLVLEGGGVKGAFAVGAMQALEEVGVKYGGITGTSIGAVNGAMYLQGGMDMLNRVWRQIDTDTVFDLDEGIIEKIKNREFDINTVVYVGKKLRTIREMLASSYEKSQKFFTGVVNEEAIRESELDFGIVTYNITDMKGVELMKEDIKEGQLVDFVIASATFPIFPAKVIEDKKYIDGGVYDNMPINLISRHGYDRVLAIRTNEESKRPRRRIEREDIEVRYIVPPTDLGRPMAFSQGRIGRLRELGYKQAKHELENGLAEFLFEE